MKIAGIKDRIDNVCKPWAGKTEHMKQDTEQLKKKTVSELLVEFGQIYQDYLAETGAYDGASLWSFARAREIRDSLHLISSDEAELRESKLSGVANHTANLRNGGSTPPSPSHNEIKREDALSWEDFMWECFYADNSTVAEDTSQYILDNLFDKWLEKQDLYELGLTFAERVRNFWETESAKNWYFDGDELVIKKGKWVIDRYQKHLTQSKEGGE